MNADLQHVLRELCEGLRRLYGKRLVRMILFGSRARGDAHPDSDIDVPVVLKGPVRPYEEIERTSALHADLALRYECVISCVFVDEQSFARRGGPLFRNVRREGISI